MLEWFDVMIGKVIIEDIVYQDKLLKGSVVVFVLVKGQRLNVQQVESLVKKSFDILEGYKLDYSQLNKGSYWILNNQVWSLSWSNCNVNMFYMFMWDILV